METAAEKREMSPRPFRVYFIPPEGSIQLLLLPNRVWCCDQLRQTSQVLHTNLSKRNNIYFMRTTEQLQDSSPGYTTSRVVRI